MSDNLKESILKRVRNYGFWVSTFSMIPLVLQVFGVENKLPQNYSDMTNAVLIFLVVAGVCNNPATNNKGYLDDKK